MPRRATTRRLASVAAATALLVALAGCGALQPAPVVRASSGISSAPVATEVPVTASSKPIAAAAPKPSFDRTAHSLDAPTSVWVVVDKQRPLKPKTYVPPDLVTPKVPHTNVPQLRRVAAAALVTMFAAAKRDGITLYSLSAYRSYATQKSIFDRNIASLGRATTLNLTAKPGYSEHQTGLADDLGDGSSCDLQVCFESHPAAKWLAKHSWQYGWVLRYPLGYTKITGIQTEPWHFRYIGKPAAKEMHRTGVKTIERFFRLPDSPDYR